MQSLLFILLSCSLVPSMIRGDKNFSLGEDVVSCLQAFNLTAEEVMNMTFFNPNVTLSHNAQCFGACLISTDYNVSVSPEGIIEKEGLLLSAIMEDKDMDIANATDVLDKCKKILSAERDGCENIYNYATCVNEVYFEKKGYKFQGNILDQNDPHKNDSTTPKPDVEMSSQYQLNSTKSPRSL